MKLPNAQHNAKNQRGFLLRQSVLTIRAKDNPTQALIRAHFFSDYEDPRAKGLITCTVYLYSRSGDMLASGMASAEKLTRGKGCAYSFALQGALEDAGVEDMPMILARRMHAFQLSQLVLALHPRYTDRFDLFETEG